jgi:ferredoxin
MVSEDAGDMPAVAVRVDQDVCIGAGQCVFAAPAVFTQREDDGVVELLQTHPAPELASAVEEAARVCPASVITLIRNATSAEAAWHETHRRSDA